MGSGSRHRRERSSSSSRSHSPDRRRRRRRRHSSSSSSPERRDSRERRHHRHHHHHHHRRKRDHSSGRSREKERRERKRSRSRSTSHKESKRKKRDRGHRSRSRSRDSRSESKKKVSEKSEHDGQAKNENPAESLKAKVKALLDKTSEAHHPVVETTVEGPTPEQILLLESNSFTADKFISKRSSKKWDVPPSGVPPKKSSGTKNFDAREVDPSEFVPKVVPMNEVENALGREGEVVEFEGEGERGVVSIKENKSSSETEPFDRNQKWLQKLKKMREKVTTDSPKTD